ncbi:MAG TPA: FtsX-like permease family protein [Gemmatimonadaceae bacterium]|nr:FtsX-like permease family protein [Gemmatimonadaceae bacterium]
MHTSQLLGLAWRESRTARRRLLLYMSSISLGVAALVAIDSFASNTQRSVREQARALLGGDIAFSTRLPNYPRPIILALDSLANEGVGLAQVSTFASMALLPRTGGTRLSQIRAVTPGYPFYGEITTSPAGEWSRLQLGPRALVDPTLLVALDAHVGDTLTLGFAKFVIAGTLVNVPGDVAVAAAAMGPRVYIPERYIRETGLLLFGSRVEHETVVKLPPTHPLQRFIFRMRPRLQAAGIRYRTPTQTEFNLTESVDQLRDFLGLIGLVALLLGGIGVASGVNAFVMRKIDTVAILRCLGATSRQVLAIYLLQAGVMGLIGAAFGAVLGVGLQFGLSRVLTDFLPVDVRVTAEPTAVGMGLLVGLWVALAFALRPLIALRNVSPLQTLRRESDADALRGARIDPARILVALGIVLSVAGLGVARAEDPRQGLAFSGAIAVAVGVLFLAATAFSDGARRVVRPSWPFVLRQGVASLYRPGNQTRAVVLALGFGVFLMSTVYQVQDNLLRTVDVKLDASRANVVFFDVQEDQDAPLDSLIRTQGYSVVQRTPIVPMKIFAINGVTIAQMAADTTPGRRRRAGWALRREFRSTFRDSIVASEKVTAGRFHTGGSPVASIPEVSIDKGVAEDMRLALGDTVTWDVQGVRVPTRVTSFREVNWTRFEPNFFVVFERRALLEAPKQYVLLADVRGTTAVPRLQRDVVGKFPNVSSLDLTLIQQTVGRVLDKVTTAIRFMAGLSLALGIPVLFSAVSATRRERLREGVLLKVLGATKRQVGRIMLAEYLLLGALGSLVGIVLSVAGAWAMMRFQFKQPFQPAVLPALAVALLMILVSVSIGLLTGRDVFQKTPMAALREA